MKHSKLRRVMGALTVLSLVIGLCCLMPETVAAITQADIDAMEDDLNKIASQIDNMKAQLEQIAGDKAQALKELDLLNEQVDLITAQIEETDRVIAKYDDLIAVKMAEIAEIEEKEAAQYKLFCKQVRSMEEQGSVSYFSILFNSSDFSDLLDRAMMIAEIMDYNNDIINMLMDTREQLAAAQAELEQERADQQDLRDKQAIAKAELEVQQAAAAALAQKLINQEAGYEAAVKELEEADKQLQKEMKEAQEELERQNVLLSENSWYWPVPGYYTLTSGFGWRTHPIYGTRKYHNGTDIGGVNIYGKAVGAVRSGVVTTAGKHVNYGNYVIVTHADGYQSLYAHMSKLAVSKGDTVTQGQTVGYVGSTGLSTGPHLHLEIWKDGVRTDSEQYYPNLNSVFYRKYNT